MHEGDSQIACLNAKYRQVYRNENDDRQALLEKPKPNPNQTQTRPKRDPNKIQANPKQTPNETQKSPKRSGIVSVPCFASRVSPNFGELRRFSLSLHLRVTGLGRFFVSFIFFHRLFLYMLFFYLARKRRFSGVEKKQKMWRFFATFSRRFLRGFMEDGDR